MWATGDERDLASSSLSSSLDFNKKNSTIGGAADKIRHSQKYNQKYGVRRVRSSLSSGCSNKIVTSAAPRSKIRRSKKYNQKYGVRWGRRGMSETSRLLLIVASSSSLSLSDCNKKIVTLAAPRTKYDAAKNTIKNTVCIGCAHRRHWVAVKK